MGSQIKCAGCRQRICVSMLADGLERFTDAGFQVTIVDHQGNAAVIREVFRKLGDRIVSCHAKDIAWGPGYQVNVQEVIPGRGVLDYPTYLRELSQLRVDAPLMLEHLRGADEYTQGREYIQGVATSAGLSFGG